MWLYIKEITRQYVIIIQHMYKIRKVYEILSCYRMAIITELLAGFSRELSVSISFDKK